MPYRIRFRRFVVFLIYFLVILLGPYVFQVTALNGISALGTDTFSYPEAPVITSLSSTGCTSSGVGVKDCPTAGNVVLTLRGTGFVQSQGTSIRVGNNICPIVQFIDSTFVKCTLPVGAGLFQPVVISAGSMFSFAAVNTFPYVNYSAPVVSSIFGCIGFCVRSGGTNVTVVGSNFGSSGALVWVGAGICSGVVHDLVTPHLKLTCISPPGVGSQFALVFQNGGLPSNTSLAQLSYEPCPAGQDSPSSSSTICSLCVAGKYSDVAGTISCLRCPSGRFTATNGATNCQVCPTGSFTGVQNGASACAPCSAGLYSSAGSSSCEICDVGTMSNRSSSACTPCAAGFYAPTRSSSTCLPCSAGTYAPLGGFASCTAASPGNYISNVGSVSQMPCSPGFFQDTPGQSTCKPCAPGTSSSVSGSIACSICDSGYFSNFTTATFCFSCSAGWYSTVTGSIGQTACTRCSRGFYTGYQ